MLRMTGHALENMVATNVCQLRMPVQVPCRPILLQTLPSRDIHFCFLSSLLSVPSRTFHTTHRDSGSGDLLVNWGRRLSPATRSFCSGRPVALLDTKQERLRATTHRTVDGAACFHLGNALLSATCSSNENAWSAQSRFTCSAKAENAGESDRLPVGLVLPKAEPIHEPVTLPQVTEDMVQLSFARSGGAGGQNVNKVNTKVDMRFNVLEADWLPDWVKEKLLETEANRINNDGELVITSTRTRTQKGNIEDALEKLNAILGKASYVPPPPSAEKIKRIKKLAKAANEKRLDGKKKLSSKKADRRNKGKWDD